MRVLVGCEMSGRVRDAFIARGHDAVSCDLLPSMSPGPHLQQDLFGPDGEWILGKDWDLFIAFPPCTYLCGSGARWWATRQVEQRKAIWFFRACADAPVPRVAIENPVGLMSSIYRRPDQIVHPWQFGHGETKRTCLWLRGLPQLVPTRVVGGRAPVVHSMAPGPQRSMLRSLTYPGIAEAMAEQWGAV